MVFFRREQFDTKIFLLIFANEIIKDRGEEKLTISLEN